MPRRVIPPEQLDRALSMVRDEGASIRAASRETGISQDTISKRLKKEQTSRADSSPPRERPSADTKPPLTARRPRDPIPGKRGRQAEIPSVKTVTEQQLVSMLTKIAVAPAVPAGLWLRCDYCASHFVVNGPNVAVQLVALAEDHPELKELLVWVHNEWEKAAWAGLLATWLGVPILHHLSPDFVYRVVAPLAGMPPRVGSSSHTAHKGEAASGASSAPRNGSYAAPPQESQPAPQSAPEEPPIPAGLGILADQLGGMDLDQLLAMAQQMGIPLDIDPNIMADAFKQASQAAPGAEPAAPDATTAAPADPDTE